MIKRLYLRILRDIFAGQALAGLLASQGSNYHYSAGRERSAEQIAASDAYDHADAMMSERVLRNRR
jgi:hypothetical protein